MVLDLVKKYKTVSGTKRIVFRNSIWLLIEQILRISFSIFVGSYVARYLGKSDYGSYSFIIMYISFFQIINSLGAEGILVRNYIHSNEIKFEILSTYLIAKVIIGFITYFISVLSYTILFNVEYDNLKLIFVSSLALLFQFTSAIELYYQSQNKFSVIVLIKFTVLLVINALKIIAIQYQEPVSTFVAIFVIEFIFISAFYLVSIYFTKVKIFFKLNFFVLKSILKDSWPFLLSSISIYLYTRIDVFFIKKLLSSDDLGLYAAAINISSALPILSMLLLNSINPIITRYYKDDIVKYENSLKKVFKLFGYLGLFLSLFFCFMSSFIIKVLYGQEYLEAVIILQVHVFTNFFIFLGVAQNLVIINENLGNVNLYKTLIGVLLSFGFNLLFIPFFGLIGAAYTAVIVQFSTSIFINMIIHPKVFKLQINFPFN